MKLLPINGVDVLIFSLLGILHSSARHAPRSTQTFKSSLLTSSPSFPFQLLSSGRFPLPPSMPLVWPGSLLHNAIESWTYFLLVFTTEHLVTVCVLLGH